MYIMYRIKQKTLLVRRAVISQLREMGRVQSGHEVLSLDNKDILPETGSAVFQWSSRFS